MIGCHEENESFVLPRTLRGWSRTVKMIVYLIIRYAIASSCLAYKHPETEFQHVLSYLNLFTCIVLVKAFQI